MVNQKGKPITGLESIGIASDRRRFTIHDLNHSLVIKGHRFRDTISQNGAQCFSASLQNLFYLAPLRTPELIEHKTLRVAQRVFGLNSHPQTDELAGTHRGNDRLQAVVPAGTAAGAQPNTSEWQRQVITNHNQRLGNVGNVILRYQASNGFAAQVHISLRLYQSHADVFDHRAAHERTTFPPLDRYLSIARQLVNQHKSEVVP